MTVTVQHCSTCRTSTYTGTVPGYTPGSPCHYCTGSNHDDPGRPASTAAIPPPLPISTTTSSTTSLAVPAVPIPLASEATGSMSGSAPPKVSLTTVPVAPPPNTSAPYTLTPSVSKLSLPPTPGEAPGGVSEPLGRPSSVQPSAKGPDPSTTSEPDQNISSSYGQPPTTPAAPYSPMDSSVVTAGAVSHIDDPGYLRVLLRMMMGFYLLDCMAFSWL